MPRTKGAWGWSGSSSRSERIGRSRRFCGVAEEEVELVPEHQRQRRRSASGASRSSSALRRAAPVAVPPRPDGRGVGLLALVAARGDQRLVDASWRSPGRRRRCSSGAGRRSGRGPSAPASSAAASSVARSTASGWKRTRRSIAGRSASIVAASPVIGLPWASRPVPWSSWSCGGRSSSCPRGREAAPHTVRHAARSSSAPRSRAGTSTTCRCARRW